MVISSPSRERWLDHRQVEREREREVVRSSPGRERGMARSSPGRERDG